MKGRLRSWPAPFFVGERFHALLRGVTWTVRSALAVHGIPFQFRRLRRILGAMGSEQLRQVLRGVDVSRWNDVDWEALRGIVEFVGFRVTWGLAGVDLKWKEHLAAIRSIGALPIAYHVEDPHSKGVAQVEHFLATLGDESGAARMLDIEPTKGAKPATAQQWADVAKDFAFDLSRERGAPPILYGSPAFLDSLSLHPDLSGCQLWLAQWIEGAEKMLAPPPSEPWTSRADHVRGDPPKLWIPRPWHRATIWQEGAHPQPDGTFLDWDRFEGTRAEFETVLATGLTHR